MKNPAPLLAGRVLDHALVRVIRSRAEVARTAAIADDIAVRIIHRHTRPVAAGAADRNRTAVSAVGHVARLHDVGRTIGVRDRTAYDGAGGDAAENAKADGRAAPAVMAAPLRIGVRRRSREGG